MSLRVLIVVVALTFNVAFLGGALRQSLRGGRDSVAFHVVRSLRLRHLAITIPALLLTCSLTKLLLLVPGLGWGWWKAVGGSANLGFGWTELHADGPLGAFLTVAAIASPVLLIMALPVLALKEELAFRNGAEGRSWAARLWRCLAFGLLYCTVGVPIAAGLALSVMGVAYTLVYLRVESVSAKPVGAVHACWRRRAASNPAVLQAAAAHAATNALLAGTVLLVAMVAAT